MASNISNSSAGLNSQDTIAGQLDLNSLGLETAITQNSVFPRIAPKAAPSDLHELVQGTSTGATLYLMSEDGTFTHATNKFFLQSFSFNVREKSQLVETFEGSSLSFFGEAVKIYNFQGVAVDHGADGIIGGEIGADGFHLSALLKLYNDHMRATKLVANNQIAIMGIMNHTVMGYPISFSTQYNAAQDKMGSFSMQMVCVKHSLALPGVVEDRHLEMLATPLSTSQKGQTAINNIDEITTAMGGIFLNKSFPILGKKKGGVFAEGASGIQNLLDRAGGVETNITAFISSFDANAEILRALLADKVTNSDGLVSPTIGGYFAGTADMIDEHFSEISTAVNALWDPALAEVSRPKWQELGALMIPLDSLRSRLITMKRKLGG